MTGALGLGGGPSPLGSTDGRRCAGAAETVEIVEAVEARFGLTRVCCDCGFGASGLGGATLETLLGRWACGGAALDTDVREAVGCAAD